MSGGTGSDGDCCGFVGDGVIPEGLAVGFADPCGVAGSTAKYVVAYELL